MQCLQCKLHVTNRLGKQLKKRSSAVSGIFLSNALPQSARVWFEFRRRDHFRDSNDFTKDIVKSFADRCKSHPTSEMSNATLSKHSERRKWRHFTFAKFISCRTMNLTFLIAFPVEIVSLRRFYLELSTIKVSTL